MATVIFLCDEEQYPGVRQEIIDAKAAFSKGNFYDTGWSSGNVTKIQVGDRAYLQRTGSYPHGFFAAGKVVAAPEKEQLKQHKDYSHFSEAYSDDFGVSLRLDSVVDFDYPLEQTTLERLPQFKEVNFLFRQSGCEFNANCAVFLDSGWEKHSLEFSRKGFGKRLIDFFYQQGETHKGQKDYQAAINAYNTALTIDSGYAKAKNAKHICENILSRKALSEPIVVHPILVKDDLISVNNEFLSVLDKIQDQIENKGFFDPAIAEDARERVLASIVQRKGQSAFRKQLLEAYNGKCCITKCDVEIALEAAHISPYNGCETNHVSNGLLLRADIHTLFDLYQISISPDTLRVVIAPFLINSHYAEISGKSIQETVRQEFRPSTIALRIHYEQFRKKSV